MARKSSCFPRRGCSITLPRVLQPLKAHPLLLLLVLPPILISLYRLSLDSSEWPSSKYNNCDGVVTPSNFPSDVEDWEVDLYYNYRIAILTTETFHPRLIWQRESWWTSRYDSVVDVLSDTSESHVNFSLPNVINTRCENTYYYGLWCKNYFMLRRWKEDPKFAKVKWFYRSMDDSWLHLENLVWMTKQYDHRQKIIIGEKQCFETDRPYPDGGPGFAISRGVIDSLTLLDNWNKALDMNQPRKIYDDVIWGILIELERITLIHTSSIMHLHMAPDVELYQLYLMQRNRTWGLSFRPVAYHQDGPTLELMPEIDRQLKNIDYGNVSPFPYTPPHCTCPIPRIHMKCVVGTYDQEIHAKGHLCAFNSGPLICHGPGPFPHWNSSIYELPNPPPPHTNTTSPSPLTITPDETAATLRNEELGLSKYKDHRQAVVKPKRPKKPTLGE